MTNLAVVATSNANLAAVKLASGIVPRTKSAARPSTYDLSALVLAITIALSTFASISGNTITAFVFSLVTLTISLTLLTTSILFWSNSSGSIICPSIKLG